MWHCHIPRYYQANLLTDRFESDRPMGPGDFAGHQTMDAGVAWDEFTTISDPHLLNTMAGKGQMINMAPNVWNPGNMPSGLPPPSPISAASPMGNQTPMNLTTAFAMQPDGTVWQVPPPPPRTHELPRTGNGTPPIRTNIILICLRS